ncbi:E3 ubiquitin-protein ligase MARCHF5-like [Ischnura elegans]|uniref:E3 ubiquitin-protein ligase MARCHF5-like n=1 Tax=Ischnura elegans TaxID=197161 RepID=UPI001ED8A2CA|nr:E3 ubiquitin-protein ligase MARCHF5-like [Ischnura elegans]
MEEDERNLRNNQSQEENRWPGRTISSGEEDEIRQCWVCFATEEDDPNAEWVQPCSCRGTAKWVHQACIQRWVDEKQKGNSLGKVSCPQCNTEYLIMFPKMGSIVLILDTANNLIYRICPFVAAAVVVGSVYWSAVTYGAVTVMQVLGHKEGMILMENADPLVLLVGLPTVPVVLILGKMVRWEDGVLQFLRKNTKKIPLLRQIFPSFSAPEEGEDSVARRISMDHPPFSDPVSATRVLCSALILPTVATIVGKIFFDSVQSNLRKTILGGIAFITVKGALKIYHKQQLFTRISQRLILDYTESNIALMQIARGTAGQ